MFAGNVIGHFTEKYLNLGAWAVVDGSGLVSCCKMSEGGRANSVKWCAGRTSWWTTVTLCVMCNVPSGTTS